MSPSTAEVNACYRQVYALLCPKAKRVKIGQTTVGVKRFGGITTGCPFPVKFLTWLGCTEAFAHLSLAEHRTHGEWFLWNAEVKAWIARNAGDPLTTRECAALRGVGVSFDPQLELLKDNALQWLDGVEDEEAAMAVRVVESA